MTENKLNSIEITIEFEALLALNSEEKNYFDKLAPSHKKEYIEWIANAKKKATRESRSIKAIEMLRKEVSK